MSVLLDTQAFFGSVHPAHRVPDHVRALLDAQSVSVSDGSAFEVATKVRLGKFDEARDLVAVWEDTVARFGATTLGVTTSHALAAGSMDWPHRDPFDRLIVAQAQVEGLTLLTADRAMLTAPRVDVRAW